MNADKKGHTQIGLYRVGIMGRLCRRPSGPFCVIPVICVHLRFNLLCRKRHRRGTVSECRIALRACLDPVSAAGNDATDRRFIASPPRRTNRSPLNTSASASISSVSSGASSGLVQPLEACFSLACAFHRNTPLGSGEADRVITMYVRLGFRRGIRPEVIVVRPMPNGGR